MTAHPETTRLRLYAAIPICFVAMLLLYVGNAIARFACRVEGVEPPEGMYP